MLSTVWSGGACFEVAGKNGQLPYTRLMEISNLIVTGPRAGFQVLLSWGKVTVALPFSCGFSWGRFDSSPALSLSSGSLQWYR